MTDAAIIYRSHVEAIRQLPEDQRLEAYEAIIAYCMDDEMPDGGIGAFTVGMAKPMLDKWKAKREAGAKGGSVEKQTESKSKANDKQIEANDKQTEAPVKQTEPKEKEKVKVKEKKNKDMSGEPDSPPLMVAVRQIVDHLNEKAGTKYMASSRATVELIKARLNERWTVEDHIKVIDNMTAAWKGDQKMEEYLRPSTLFARAHFEEYLNRKPTAGTGTNRFQNFPSRQDQQHKDMVAQIIAMNAGGRT